MNNKVNGKTIVVFAVIALVFFGIVYGGITLTRNIGKSKSEIKVEDAQKELSKVLRDVEVTEMTARKASVELGSNSLSEELPDISKYPITVQGDGIVNIEIFTSPEKGGTGNDAWLNEVAKNFNASGAQVNGQTATVTIRSIASGDAADYIVSGKYTPDAFTPSNELWGDMIIANGGNINMEKDRLVGNVAGVLLNKDKYDSLTKTYGAINMKTITSATAANEIAMGYTNPLSSSTGLNFLLSTLCAYDSKNPLSATAAQGFNDFQANVPFVAYTTMQMREAAQSGSLDGMILEYQTYVNEPELSDYEFTPFGVRHDNPIYSVGALSADKKAVLDSFIEYCLNSESQKSATDYGFNGLDSYVSELGDVDGKMLLSAQKLWKENKDAGRPITAVFVADTSGSMDGDPLNQLKSSLINSAKYINDENYIGLVSYNNSVFVNLPIAKFDLNQWSYFQGAVEDLEASGGTASYDGVAVGVDMLVKAKEKNPNTKLMLFLLSDGETNLGHSLDDVRDILAGYAIPVYTIGYNADIEALKTISDINEAASISADSDDVIYKLKSLFNAQM